VTRDILLFLSGIGVLYFGAEWLVLGISAMLRPLHVSARVVTREVPVMILITIVLLPLIWDEYVWRFEGVLLLAMLFAYLAYVLRSAGEEDKEALGKYDESTRKAVRLYPPDDREGRSLRLPGHRGSRARGLRHTRVRHRACGGDGDLGAGDRSHVGLHRHFASRVRHLRGLRLEARSGHRGGEYSQFERLQHLRRTQGYSTRRATANQPGRGALRVSRDDVHHGSDGVDRSYAVGDSA